MSGKTAIGSPNTRKAAVIIVPFLLLGIGNVLLILQWGLDLVWGLLLVPPVLFISAMGWIAISGGLVDRESEP
jgi:hypothetical protein